MKRTLTNLATLLVAIAFSLGIVEVALRIRNPFGQRVRFGSIVLPVNRVETLRNDRVPGVPALAVKRRNALGFRGAHPPPDLASRLSVVTVGGSTYADETPAGMQGAAPKVGKEQALYRCDTVESTEVDGGNGIDGDDETSEDCTHAFVKAMGKPTPRAAPEGLGPCP